jgi:hypothetical protein
MGYLKPKKAKARLANAIQAYENLMKVINVQDRSSYKKPGSQKSIN